MHNSIIWNGISSETLGLKVERYPNQNRPARKYTVADVAGRNGSVYILQDAWGEVVQSYEIAAKDTVPSFKAVAEWLHSANGYAVLQDSYDPEIYRLAVCVNPFEVETALNRAGRALIQFNCRPERFLLEEDTEIAAGATETVTNPTNHTAQPLFKVIGQGYPSMLPFTGRTDVLNTYDNSFNIEGLGVKKRRYRFIGISDAASAEVDYNIDQDPSKIDSYAAIFDGGLSFRSTDPLGRYGIGINRSVSPNTTYTVSLKYTTINSNNARLSVITTDKNGFINGKVGSITLTPSADTPTLTFTTGAEAYWAVLLFLPTTSGSCVFDHVMMNLGEEALPYVDYEEDTSGSFTVGDVRVNISELYDYMYFDTQSLNAFREAGENLNPMITLTDLSGAVTEEFPCLKAGANTVYGGDGWVQKIIITPRFWTL